MQTRRRLILALGGALLGAAAPLALLRRRAPSTPSPARPAPERFAQPLRIPGADGLLAEVRLNQELELAARVAQFALLPGVPTTLLHYAVAAGGRVCANPLLRVERGTEVHVSIANALDEPTTLHWHGLAVDEASDGSGLHPIAPGVTRRCRLAVQNRAGLYWYHAHPHGRTGFQLQNGLAGLLLVEDDEERALRGKLDLEWGVRDLPLMVCDKQIDANNAIVYRDGADDWIGNRALVNWSPLNHSSGSRCDVQAGSRS